MEQETPPLMLLELKHKGKHPGEVVGDILKEHGIAQRQLALFVGEFPQTLWAVIKGKRSMNTALADRIERALRLPQGYLMTLQLFYDLEQLQKQQGSLSA